MNKQLIKYWTADMIKFSRKDSDRIYKAWKSCAEYAERLHQLNPDFPYLKMFYSGIPGTTFYKILAMWYFGELLLAFQHNSLHEAYQAHSKYKRIVYNIYYCDSPGLYIRNGLLLTQGK